MQVWANFCAKFEASLKSLENSAVGQESLSDKSLVTNGLYLKIINTNYKVWMYFGSK